jgi:opacity protein-like surface antigen
MTRFKILGAAAILASALASPAMAQEVVSNPGYCAQFYPNANCQNRGPGNPYTGSYQQTYGNQAYRQNGWQNSNNRWDGDRRGDRDSVMVGRAYGANGGDEYARRNGFVCIPGTLFRGEDGRQHICQ